MFIEAIVLSHKITHCEGKKLKNVMSFHDILPSSSVVLSFVWKRKA